MFRVLKQTPEYIVIDKSAGVVVHADGKTNQDTLCDGIVQKYPDIVGVGEPMQINGRSILRPGIVHRLDKDTSGVMIIARTQAFFEYIKNEFKTRKVKKIYHAFVYGNIREDSIRIDEPIGRSAKNIRSWATGEQARGTLRDAVTHVSVLKRTEDKGLTFVEATPYSGRTHQIRVHLKHIYHPIVSDPIYAPQRPSLLGFSRTALHAHSISFVDMQGHTIQIEAPYPDDFIHALSLIK